MARLKKLNIDPAYIINYRMDFNLTQTQFWTRYGSTQSAGSRYETGGRKIPNPIKMLIALDTRLADISQLLDGTLAGRV